MKRITTAWLVVLLLGCKVKRGFSELAMREVSDSGGKRMVLYVRREEEQAIPDLMRVLEPASAMFLGASPAPQSFTALVQNESAKFSPEIAATLLIAGAGVMRNSPTVPRIDRIREDLALTEAVLSMSEGLPPEFTTTALREFGYVTVDPLEGVDWSKFRERWSVAWLQNWRRYSDAMDSIDGEAPPGRFEHLPLKPGLRDLGISGFSPESLADGSAKQRYADALKTFYARHAQQAVAHAQFDRARECFFHAEHFLTNSFARPPFASATLVEALSKHLGANHPAVRRIGGKLAEKLPESERKELEALIASLPPPGNADEIRTARKAAAEQGRTVAGKPSGQGKVATRKHSLPAAAQSPVSAPSAPLATAAPETNNHKLLWSLSLGALGLIGGVLWRAHLRGASRGPK